ncbi:hypothetical protein EVAR_96617_1 [Eumeta japonica]|uniref:DDE-1 domain-containing protein n=1 Tax=Eumeta variegata TaxID=151549 RepID=A0A4C1WUN9_EUMVA|nr:hypothetical protein EVAR_96617_1 [Eumeta japonica]
MLETSRDNDVILLCLPSHTTSALQPLDISVFGPFKKYYYAETNNFIRTNPQKKLNRYNSGQLIARAWIRATTPANAISGFRGSGIYPINPNALSDAEFAISDIASGELTQEQESETINDQVPGASGELALRERIQESEYDRGNVLSRQNKVTLQGDQVSSYCDKNNSETIINEAEQNCMNQSCTPPRPLSSLLALSHDCLALGDGEIENYILENTELSLPSLISLNESQNKDQQKQTPSKFLYQSSPIPKIPLSISKRAKQSAEILNSNDKIIEKKNKTEKLKKTSVMKQTNETKNKLVGSKEKITKLKG